MIYNFLPTMNAENMHSFKTHKKHFKRLPLGLNTISTIPKRDNTYKL